MPSTPPMPLECHPAYRDRAAVVEWLNAPDGPHTLEVPVAASPGVRGLYDADAWDQGDPIRTLALTRRIAWGLAPYVGRPFVYVWHFATDPVGRSVAGESVIAYTTDIPEAPR